MTQVARLRSTLDYVFTVFCLWTLEFNVWLSCNWLCSLSFILAIKLVPRSDLAGLGAVVNHWDNSSPRLYVTLKPFYECLRIRQIVNVSQKAVPSSSRRCLHHLSNFVFLKLELPLVGVVISNISYLFYALFLTKGI